MNTSTSTRLHTLIRDMNALTSDIRDETAKVNASGDHIAIIRNYDELRTAMAQIKEAREALDGLAETLSREVVPDTMRAHNIKTITIENVGRVTISQRWSASMIDKDRGFDWLRETGNESLIQETVNAQTLAAFAKDMLVTQGKELPDNIFKVGQMSYTSITKA